MSHSCIYVNSAGTAIQLNDGSRFVMQPEGLPRGIYNPAFESLAVTVPSDLPAAVWQTYLMKPREIEMTIMVLGTPSRILDSAAMLMAVFTPDIRDKAMGTWTYIADNGLSRSIRCSLGNVGDVANWLSRMRCDQAAAEVVLQLDCPDPTFYDPIPLTANGAFNNAANVNIAVTNNGNMPGYLELLYTGLVENPQFTDNYGRLWLIEGELTHANDTLYMNLDPQEFEVTYTPNAGVAMDWSYRVSIASLIPHARPGTHNLVFTAVAGTATIMVTTYSRYIAHGMV